MPCALAADAKLETPEGPLTVKTVGVSPTPVMVLDAESVHRFTMSTDVRVVAAAQPVLRVTLDNGRAVRLGPEQMLLAVDGVPRRVGDLRAGDRLLCAFAFPVGYAYRSDAGDACLSDGGVGVAGVADGGSVDLYSLHIPTGARLVLSAGLVAPAAP